jgi:hypothetical protein
MIDVAPDRIVDLGLAFRGAKVRMAAVELGVFTALAEEASAGGGQQAKLGIHEPAPAISFAARRRRPLQQRARNRSTVGSELHRRSRRDPQRTGFEELALRPRLPRSCAPPRQHWYGSQETARVGMLGLPQYALGRPCFDDPSTHHYGDTVGEGASHRDIMRYQQVGDGTLLLDIEQKIEDLATD